MDYGDLAAILGIIAAVWFIAAIIAVIGLVAMWKIFTKMGEPGWKSLIPYYNNYVLMLHTWDIKYFWVMLACSIAGPAIASLGASLDSGIGAIISLISAPVSLTAVIISFIALYKLCKAFGKGVGYFLGILFLYPIFILMLAFGDSRYIGGVPGSNPVYNYTGTDVNNYGSNYNPVGYFDQAQQNQGFNAQQNEYNKQFNEYMNQNNSTVDLNKHNENN